MRNENWHSFLQIRRYTYYRGVEESARALHFPTISNKLLRNDKINKLLLFRTCQYSHNLNVYKNQIY